MTSTVLAPETAEPGFGFVTVTEILPTWLASAVPVAVNCVEETNVVASGVVPKLTTAPFTKPVPVRVRVNGPVVTEEGVTVVSTGTGFNSVIAEFPDCVLSMTLVAVTVMVFGCRDGERRGIISVADNCADRVVPARNSVDGPTHPVV